MSGHCCHSALNESQPRKLYLATVGRYLSFCCQCTLPNTSPVACCLAFPSSLPPKPHLHISSTTSPPTVAESIRHYQKFPIPASSRRSLQNLQPLTPAARVHLSAVLNCSVPEEWTDASSKKKISHTLFLPLVEGTKVGLPHPIGKLLEGECLWLQADWGLAVGPAQVRRIMALIICIEFVIRILL